MQRHDYLDFAENGIKIKFKNIKLLMLAFTHRSYINEHKKSATEHNERLEFLGDAVLELATTEYIYRKYEEPEGVMTAWRSALVRTESISEVAAELGFEPMLRLSRGEKRGSERARQQILANTFESVVGAIYLDRGYKAAAKFIEEHLLSKLEGIIADGSWRDAKSHLQELAQAVDAATPDYRVMAEDGPDHEKIFTIGVFVGKHLRGQGEGPSKQEAQQAAANAALQQYYLVRADK